MLEVLLLMISVGVQSASTVSGQSTASMSVAAAPAPAQPAVSAPESVAQQPAQEAESVVAPAFLAPKKPELVAEPQVPTGKFTTAVEVKPILNATKGSWITVREYNGQDLVYVTHLWAWRCGLVELRIGLNGNDPEPWPLPECHLDQPSPGAILENDGLPYRNFGQGSIAMVEVEITYDDLTTDSAKYNRQGVQIP